MIEIAFVTWNRLDYTRLALGRLLADPSDDFRVSIWDNASTDGTREYLEQEVSDPRVHDITLSETNVGQVAALNTIWSNSRADLLGKVDNDCLLPVGWTATLARAHHDIPRLGVVACWHYPLEDFDHDRAAPKIQEHNGHHILRHPWTCGTGVLIKRSTYERIGPLWGTSTTPYWIAMAQQGYINGFHYPLIHQEHMDDPKSPYTRLTDEAAYQAAKHDTFNINHHDQDTLADRWRWRQQVLDNLLEGPWDVAAYVGWRGRLRRLGQDARRRLSS